MIDRETVQLPVRFAVLRASVPTLKAWMADQPAPSEVLGGPVTLVVWGRQDTTVDGRVIGALCGMVLNHDEVRGKIAQRGLDPRLDSHPRLAVQHVGAFGVAGLADLRWHGSLALLHRGTGTALVARDLLGVGWLGWRSLGADEVVFSNDARLTGMQAVPPGLAVQLDMGGVRGVRVSYAPQNQAFLREIPDELRRADPQTVAAGLRDRMRAAVLACIDAHNAIARPPGNLPQFVRDQLDLCGEGPTQWTAAGLGEPPVARAEELPSRDGPWPDPGPAEPVDRIGPDELRRRLWRHRALPDGQLRQEQAEAMTAGRCLVAPHLDPAVVAWMGAAAQVGPPR